MGFFTYHSAKTCRVSLVDWQYLTEGQIYLAVCVPTRWDMSTDVLAVKSNTPVWDATHEGRLIVVKYALKHMNTHLDKGLNSAKHGSGMGKYVIRNSQTIV